jgi:hypothetical protein
MENYAGLIVYLWSIWGGITNSIGWGLALLGLALFFATLIQGIAYVEDQKEMKEFGRKYTSKLWKPFVGLWILTILIPSKENMLLIIAANPIAKTIVESATDGKLSKLNQLTDMALDKAILKLKEGE